MSEKYQYPKVIVGAFIFNEKDELFLIKSPKWSNYYVCPGRKVEEGESLKEALVRETKEETNMDLENIEFLTVIDGLGLKEYKKEDNHLIFINYKARSKSIKKIKLNDEATGYKWLKPEDWLKKENVNRFVRLTIERFLIKNESFEYKYKRALADYQNLLKRTAREKQEFAKYANEQLVYEFIPVYDNLKMSLIHADNESKNNGWLEGIKHVTKQFKNVLKSIGVEEINTFGEKFNPELMEAIEGQGEKVKKELKPGYKLNDKVIIPAKVILE